MKSFNVELSDDLAQKFQTAVLRRYMGIRGHQNKAFVKAVQDWVTKEEAEEP